jgi:mannose-P-dolichol utilization defect protein 1
MENHTNRSTGNLSAFAVFSALLGCLARMFTTQQEINDPLVFWGFAGATLLNSVLAVQMVFYWKNSSHGDEAFDMPLSSRFTTKETLAAGKQD